MSRGIEGIVIHTAYTPPSMDIGVEEIRRWHMNREPPFRDIGYHEVIRRDGTIEYGRPLEEMGAHVLGHNEHTIGICLVGGKAEDADEPELNYTRDQWAALEASVSEKFARMRKQLFVEGHNDYDPGRWCPGFNVREWWNGRK